MQMCSAVVKEHERDTFCMHCTICSWPDRTSARFLVPRMILGLVWANSWVTASVLAMLAAATVAFWSCSSLQHQRKLSQSLWYKPLVVGCQRYRTVHTSTLIKHFPGFLFYIYYLIVYKFLQKFLNPGFKKLDIHSRCFIPISF